MLMLTRLNGKKFYVNPELIQTVEETPNTIISFVDHTKLVIMEPAEIVIELFLEYQQRVHRPLLCEKRENSCVAEV